VRSQVRIREIVGTRIGALEHMPGSRSSRSRSSTPPRSRLDAHGSQHGCTLSALGRTGRLSRPSDSE
jgi:hypothetical protein